MAGPTPRCSWSIFNFFDAETIEAEVMGAEPKEAQTTESETIATEYAVAETEKTEDTEAETMQTEDAEDEIIQIEEAGTMVAETTEAETIAAETEVAETEVANTEVAGNIEAETVVSEDAEAENIKPEIIEAETIQAELSAETLSDLWKGAETSVKEFRRLTLEVLKLKQKDEALNLLIADYEERLDGLLKDQERDKPLLDELAEIERHLKPHKKYLKSLLQTHEDLKSTVEKERRSCDAYHEQLEQDKRERIAKMESVREEKYQGTKHWQELEEEVARLDQQLSSLKIIHQNGLDRLQLGLIREVTQLRTDIHKSRQQVELYKEQKAALNAKVAELLEEKKKLGEYTSPARGTLGEWARAGMSTRRAPEQENSLPAGVGTKLMGPPLFLSLKPVVRETTPEPQTGSPVPSTSMVPTTKTELEGKDRKPKKICLEAATVKKPQVVPTRAPTPQQKPKKTPSRNSGALHPPKKLALRMSPLSFKEPPTQQSLGSPVAETSRAAIHPPKELALRMPPLSFREPLTRQSPGLPAAETNRAAAASGFDNRDESSSKRPRVTRTLLSRTYKTMGPQEF